MLRISRQDGFSMIELLGVLFVIGLLAALSWQALMGWRERNALRMVSQDVKYLFEKYRQRAVDKGYNYGLIFSDDGLYVFEDNGGNGSDRFLTMNNFAVDPGEYSDRVGNTGEANQRGFRRVSSAVNEYSLFNSSSRNGTLLAMTMTSLDLDGTRTGDAFVPAGTDISSSAVQTFSGSDDAPFESGSLALFFCSDGLVYLKDPTQPIQPFDRGLYRLGDSVDPFYVVRIAYDNPDTARAEIPDYFEVALNRYGAATYVRWHSNDGGATWHAQIQ